MVRSLPMEFDFTKPIKAPICPRCGKPVLENLFSVECSPAGKVFLICCGGCGAVMGATSKKAVEDALDEHTF